MKIRARQPTARVLLQAAADGRLIDFLHNDGREEHFEMLPTAYCTSGCNVLHWAAGNGHGHVVDFLLQPPQRARPTTNDGDDYIHHHDNTPMFHVDCPAVGKSQGRTALHYAARNGHLPTVQQLVETYGAQANVRAKHGVTPLQLAVWQGRLDVAQYLAHQCDVPAEQTNDFDCGLVHWMGLAPRNNNGSSSVVVDMARWLHQDLHLDVTAVQKQGHSALHKAAWGGHLDLCRYLHESAGMWDDKADGAGNYAVDLARMAQHDVRLIDYLQRVASRTTYQACQVLQVHFQLHQRTVLVLQRAYRQAVRTCHPDQREQRRRRQLLVEVDGKEDAAEFERQEEALVGKFQSLTRAYQHLMTVATNDADNERLLQDHASHELPRLLTADGSNPEALNEDCFEARLLQVVRQSSHGLDLSNLVKKWKQVWPGVDFPRRDDGARFSSLQEWLRQKASHVVNIRADDHGVLRLYAKPHLSQHRG